MKMVKYSNGEEEQPVITDCKDSSSILQNGQNGNLVLVIKSRDGSMSTKMREE